MKKIFLSLLTTFFLVSCFWNSKEDWLKDYESKNFSIRIPEKWKIIENKDWILPKPRSGELELSITSNEKINNFYNNLLILSEKLEKNISTEDYTKSLVINNEKENFEYKFLEEKEIKFSDSKKWKLEIFEARYDNSTPKLKFLQTSSICEDKKAYTITLAIPTNIEKISQYEYMLSTFKCKN